MRYPLRSVPGARLDAFRDTKDIRRSIRHSECIYDFPRLTFILTAKNSEISTNGFYTFVNYVPSIVKKVIEKICGRKLAY